MFPYSFAYLLSGLLLCSYFCCCSILMLLIYFSCIVMLSIISSTLLNGNGDNWQLPDFKMKCKYILPLRMFTVHFVYTIKNLNYPSNPIFMSVYSEWVLTCQFFIWIYWNKIVFLINAVNYINYISKVNFLACLGKKKTKLVMICYFLHIIGFDLQIIYLRFLHVCSCLILNCKCAVTQSSPVIYYCKARFSQI